MNEIQENRHNVNSLIQQSFNNCIKCSHDPAETKGHRDIKYMLAEFCYSNKIDFATEVIFRDNSRADFVIKDWGIIFEILYSESISDFKKKKYPLPSIPIKVDYDSLFLGKINDMLADLSQTNGKAWDYYYKKHIDEGDKYDS